MNKYYDKHGVFSPSGTWSWAGIRWRLNARCSQWFERDGMVVNREVDVIVRHKVNGPGVVQGQAQRHVVNPWCNRLKTWFKSL